MLCMSMFTFLFFMNTFLRFAKLIPEDQNNSSRFLKFNVKVKVHFQYHLIRSVMKRNYLVSLLITSLERTKGIAKDNNLSFYRFKKKKDL